MSLDVLYRVDVMLRVTKRPHGTRGGRKIPGRIVQVKECHRGELSQQTVRWVDASFGSNCLRVSSWVDGAVKAPWFCCLGPCLLPIIIFLILSH